MFAVKARRKAFLLLRRAAVLVWRLFCGDGEPFFGEGRWWLRLCCSIQAWFTSCDLLPGGVGGGCGMLGVFGLFGMLRMFGGWPLTHRLAVRYVHVAEALAFWLRRRRTFLALWQQCGAMVVSRGASSFCCGSRSAGVVWGRWFAFFVVAALPRQRGTCCSWRRSILSILWGLVQ